MKRNKIAIGITIGNFYVLEEIIKEKAGRNRIYVLCQCLLCGGEKEIAWQNVKARRTTSCGCLQKSKVSRALTTHGESGSKATKEYTAWRGIIYRCENKKCRQYENYGGRGIKIFPEWRKSFKEFLSYIGRAPSKDHTVDRINNEGDYAPGNVRWATRKEQNNNRRKRRYAKKPHQHPV